MVSKPQLRKSLDVIKEGNGVPLASTLDLGLCRLGLCPPGVACLARELRNLVLLSFLPSKNHMKRASWVHI